MNTLEQLLAERNILKSINQLFIGTDRKDWAAVEAVFAPQVVFDMTSMGAPEVKQLSPKQITAAWEEGLKDIEHLHHQTGNFEMEIEGARAQASCYGIAYHYRSWPDGHNTRAFVGDYAFQLVLQDGHWLINHFRFNLKFIEGNPDL
ncbi:MAG: nuclear transport factor 2 family protein [Lewinellaceae bacterium]|nr:nuclear transport factor 2 family protein [Lewinellaceae bacterium]